MATFVRRTDSPGCRRTLPPRVLPSPEIFGESGTDFLSQLALRRPRRTDREYRGLISWSTAHRERPRGTDQTGSVRAFHNTLRHRGTDSARSTRPVPRKISNALSLLDLRLDGRFSAPRPPMISRDSTRLTGR